MGDNEQYSKEVLICHLSLSLFFLVTLLSHLITGVCSCKIVHGTYGLPIMDFLGSFFRRSAQYQISRKSVHLGPRCYVRTDMAKWHLSLLCERIRLFHLSEARNYFNSRS